MPKNQSQPPYNDDFDESKNFQQVLFKPGLAVQARELTQMQTILQSQIERFGNHVFASGSKVSGGETHVSQNVFSAKLKSTYNGSGISVTGTEGQYAKGRTSGLIGEIIMVIPADNTDPHTLVFQPRVTGKNSGMFANDEVIDLYSDQGCTTATGVSVQAASGSTVAKTGSAIKMYNQITLADATGVAVGHRVVHPRAPIGTYVTSITGNVVYTNIAFPVDVTAESFTFADEATKQTMVVSISEGVFYVEGYFVYCAPQQIVLDKYFRSSSYSVGLRYTETIVTPDDDDSLLDNSQGSSNYSAPGADRLSIPLVLDKIAIVGGAAGTDTNFFEVVRIVEGAVERQVNNPIYADLQKEMSRRTFEEAGNYVVRPFTLNLKDDTRYANALLAELSPGKAYVNGNEIETISATKLRLDRAQDFESVVGFDISSYFGSYLKINAPASPMPQIGTGTEVELHNVTTGFSSSTKIGTASVRFFEYDSGTGASAVFRAYLFNTKLTGSLGSTRALVTTVAGSYASISSTLIVNASGIVGGSATLFEYTDNSLVFPVPQNFTKTVTTVSYKTKRVFNNVVFSSGVATLTTNNAGERFSGGSGTIPSSVALTNYVVSVVVAGGTFAANTFVPLDQASRTVTIPVVSSGVPGQVQINLKDSSFNGSCDVITTIDITGDARRVKTLLTDQQMAFATPTSTMSLLTSDVYRIKGVYMSPNLSTVATTSHTNVTANYIFDNGQRDTHYDHATISLIPGSPAATGRLLVVFDYFAHSGGSGYFSVDSYAVDYASIPAYTDSTGTVIQLRDALDFRPRRLDGSTATSFVSFQIPEPTSVDTNLSYYLSRIDKIVMSADGKFKVLNGIPSYNNPQPPADLEDGMTIATLSLPPYTLTAGLVKIAYENNRRYTMRDIAALDARLGNVEYYTALSSLEKNVMDRTLTDSSGNALFKNGFLSDNFSSFEVSDVGNADFRAAIDTVRGFARPQFKLNNVALAFNAPLSTSKRTGDLVTSPYTVVPLIQQTLASGFSNINPFNVLSNIGVLSISPSSDVWYQSNDLPVVNIVDDNTSAFQTAQANALKLNQSANWGEWSTYWTGTSLDSSGNTVQTTQQARFKTSYEVSSTTATTTNTSVVSTDLIPYVREKVLTFDVSGMVPYTTLFCWMDGVNMSTYVTPDKKPLGHTGICSLALTAAGTGYTSAPTVAITGGGGTGATAVAVVTAGKVTGILLTTYGSGYTSNPTVAITGGGGTGATATCSISVPTEGMAMTTDVNGKASGKLRIPNTSTVKFASGSKRIIFSDNTDSVYNSSSFSDATYLAQGYINNTQKTIVSTRLPTITTTDVRDTRTSTTASTATRDTYQPSGNLGTKTFIDSTDTGTSFVAILMNTTGVSQSVAQSVANGVISAYNTAAASNPDRAYGTQVGLPDFNGAMYWATTAIRTGSDPATLTTNGIKSAITPTGTEAAAWRALNTACQTDPLAQTFFIDGNRNPLGVFVSAVDLYFASKDTVNPVTVEIRPVVNGYPSSSTIVPFTQVTLHPEDITTSTLANAATNVKFDSPVFLAPGEYAIVLKANSNKYTVFTAEMGKVILGQQKTITQQPYVGSLFKSQNASTWTAVQEEDLCFTLYKCEFAIGTTTFQLSSAAPSASFDYDLLRLTAQELDFGNTTDLDVRAKVTDKTTGVIGSFQPILQNSDVQYTSRNKVALSGDLVFEYTLVTRSRDVSPVVDLERSSAILVQNVVNAAATTNPETLPYGGDASAKYVSKKVTLSQGFDADSLVIYLDANRPAGTTIEVYYKVQNSFDNTNFLNLPWTKMKLEDGGATTSKAGEYVEDKYGAYNITYTNNGTVYSNFRSYQIKVVMYSSNVSVVPSFTDLRAIAAV